MDERIVELFEPMEKHLGASAELLVRLRQYVGQDLPADYLEFLRWSNGAAGQMWPSVPLIRHKVTEPQGSHLLFSVEEVIECGQRPDEPVRKWRETWPGYLAISLAADFVGLIDTRSRDPQGMVFALGDPEDGTAFFRLRSFSDFIEHHSMVLVDLTRADLRAADLQGVRLFHAILHYACLSEADLTGADLRSALLEGADFSNARLTDAQLDGAIYDEDTRWPQGFDPQQHGASLP
jgi:hypothetical protein